MKERIELTAIIRAIKSSIETGSSLACHEELPQDAVSSVCCYLEASQKKTADSKLFFNETISVHIHILSGENDSSQDIYGAIRKAEECLTDEIVLPQGVCLVMQKFRGMAMMKQNELLQRHPVLLYDIQISYSFRNKE